MAIEKLQRYGIQLTRQTTKSAVELIWDGETNATAMLLSGNGYFDLRTAGMRSQIMQQHQLVMFYYQLKTLL